MRTIHKEAVGNLTLLLRSDRSVYLGRPDEYGVMDTRETLRIGGSAGICTELAEALTRMAARLREPRFDEEKPPAGHHAAPLDDREVES